MNTHRNEIEHGALKMITQIDDVTAGYPRTVTTVEAGNLVGFLVRFRALGPVRAKLADRAGLLGSFAIAGGLVAWQMTQPVPAHVGWWIASIAGPVLGARFLRSLFRLVVASPVAVRFRPDVIEILVRKRVVRRVRRSLEHRFALLENDRAEIEKEIADFDNRKGRKAGIFSPLYHHHAPHLVLDVMGGRIDVATVLGKATAARILGRLAACDQLMAEQAAVGHRDQLTPADEQKPRPGGLPEDEYSDATGA